MPFIKLSKGLKTKISECDFIKVSNLKWYASFSSDGIIYAKRIEERKSIYLHTFILGKRKGKFVDHINGNTLDNRRENLRHVTPSQNNINQKKRRGRIYNISGIYYLCKNKYPQRNKRWVARGQFSGHKWCKYFITKNEAIKWQKQKHSDIFGQYKRRR